MNLPVTWNASWKKHSLRFLKPSGTSRGILYEKPSYFLMLRHPEDPDITGIGECSIIPGLSPDKLENIEGRLDNICNTINDGNLPPDEAMNDYPALKFALETALLDADGGGRRRLFPSEFVDRGAPIPINGLIWMGSFLAMKDQIREKIDQGYRCIKIKIGALDFDEELRLIKHLRREYIDLNISIRLDANGAFKLHDAIEKLNILSEQHIHSIEQPLRPGQWEDMAALCEVSPIPIALDEELIGWQDEKERKKLIDAIQPAYVILKPSLLGGLEEAGKWAKLAEASGIGWWVTSALESNIGLNAIAQWTATLKNPMEQGLGTGSLYSNNLPSPLYTQGGNLWHDTAASWDLRYLIP